MQNIVVADIFGVLLNAMFLDALEADVERLNRINQTIMLIEESRRNAHPQKLRIVPVLFLQPSQDLGALAHAQFQRFPRVLRHFLRGIGASQEKAWDFLSYLAFDEAYTKPLISLGYEDTITRRSEIRAFLST